MTKLVVIGSSNTDMIIQVPELPRPGETVLGGAFNTAPGGKGANQAVAAARAGGDVSLIACVGRDMFGEQALAGFAEAGINTKHCVIDEDAPSGIAQIVVSASGENSIAVASGANARLSPRHLDAAKSLIAAATVVVLQLETPVITVLHAAQLAAQADSVVILNPAPAQALPDELYPLLSLITPNETEAELLTGITVQDENDAARAADVLHAKGVDTVIITRGNQGVYLSQRSSAGETQRKQYAAFAVTAVDTTAAGDVFNGCLAVALTEGRKLDDAIAFAQGAAAIAVQTLGAQTSAPERQTIIDFIS
jgi:ribokinase